MDYDMNQKIYSLIPSSEVAFPGIVISMEVDGNTGMSADSLKKYVGRHVFVTLRKNTTWPVHTEDVCATGCVCLVAGLENLPNRVCRVILKGEFRARSLRVFEDTEEPKALIIPFPMEESDLSDNEREAILRSLKEYVYRFVSVAKKMPGETKKRLTESTSLEDLMDRIIASVPIPPGFRQAILEADDLNEQFRVIGKVLLDETEILSIRQDIDARLQQTLEKNQKDYVLREQMKTIRSELGEGTEEEADAFLKKTEELTASEEIKKAIRNEIRRYQNMGQNSSEGQVIRSYIETLLALPWDKTAEDSTDLKRAEEILERDHYGLTKIKERIMEFLAVKERISNAEAPILCLVGPPGTGKTSIAKSIAEAMNRPYVRVCLGGVRDEAEIRGHRRTYVASMPGRIVNGLKQAGVKNPLMLLDELDKLGSDYKGDPSAALLEVLDSAQNSRFIDHYVDLPVDLSNIVFIATANTTDTIPRPLLDRVEVLELDSYTENEKVHIAKGYLVPKQLKAHGITAKEVAFSEAAIRDMIRFYTREAGVRELERVIGKVCRKVIRKHAGEENPAKENVSKKNLTDYLGIYRYHDIERVKKPQVGIARGLAWTAVGGTTLEIEVNALKGTGRIGMTGRLGEVMQESASAGISYIRSVADRYSLPEDYFEKHDIFIHIPEGAVPKDGPSAGITIATAVLSAVTGIPVDSELAMTGEITMRGRVLPIGGLKEKMLAAKKVGINKILVPDDNREDVSEISEEIREGMDIRFVTDMGQVLNEAFVR